MDNFNKDRKHPNMRNRKASTHARGKDSIRKAVVVIDYKNSRKTKKLVLKLGQTRRKTKKEGKTTRGPPDCQIQKSHKHNSYSHLPHLIWKNFLNFSLLWIINEILASGRIHHILRYLLYKIISIITIYRCYGSYDNCLIFSINVNILLFILIILLISLILIPVIAILKGV